MIQYQFFKIMVTFHFHIFETIDQFVVGNVDAFLQDKEFVTASNDSAALLMDVTKKQFSLFCFSL